MRLITWLRKLADGTSKEEAVGTDNPLPVTLTGDAGSGALEVVAPAAESAPVTAVQVTHESSPLVSANSDRVSLRIYNRGNADMAIAAGSAVWANRVIVLSPGDLWEETSAANLAWAAVTASALSATTAGVQEVLK